MSLPSNSSFVPEELKWLYREIWIWRSLILVMVLFFSGIEILKWKQLNNHNEISVVFQTKIESDHARMIGMIARNYDMAVKIDEHLRQCSGCHSHPVKAH
jgi:hypothetical protein